MKRLSCLLILALSHLSYAAEPAKKSLYDRLGGKSGVAALADAFVAELHADPRLEKNPEIRTIKTKVTPTEAKQRLNTALCHASGGPCKTTKDALLKGLPPKVELSSLEWFYIAQDANRAMDKKKVGVRERKDLLALLMKGRAGE